MEKKKVKIIIPILIAIVILVLIIPQVLWIARYYPYNVPLIGKNAYDKIQKTENYYISEYGFFPDKLPQDAKSVKMYAFTGFMQAKFFCKLSFLTDEEFFKKEVERFGRCNIYLYSGDDKYGWSKVETGYTGEVKDCEELKETYSASGRDAKINVPYIPRKEWSDTCIYVVDEYCYIAYSSASGRIVYYLSADYSNGYGDASLSDDLPEDDVTNGAVVQPEEDGTSEISESATEESEEFESEAEEACHAFAEFLGAEGENIENELGIKAEDARFSLEYVNDDDIPEMFVGYNTDCYILSYIDGNIVKDAIKNTLVITVFERENLICPYKVNAFKGGYIYMIYELKDDGTLEYLCSQQEEFDPQETDPNKAYKEIYEIGGKDVAKEEYNEYFEGLIKNNIQKTVDFWDEQPGKYYCTKENIAKLRAGVIEVQ